MNCNLRFMNRLVELLLGYKIKGSLKRFADLMYSNDVVYSVMLCTQWCYVFNVMYSSIGEGSA